MLQEDKMIERRDTSEAQGILTFEVEKVFTDFISPEIELLKESFKDYGIKAVSISVRTRSYSFTTTPPTTVGVVPVSMQKRSSRFWMKVVEAAPEHGFKASYFPRKKPPYIFDFTMEI